MITFVGRPVDSKKGLPTFLDALVLVGGLRRVPTHQVWIIGGDPLEEEFVATMIRARPRLARHLRRGTLTLWGRVEQDALAELYSRSHVVVLPSTREQFGLVAVEAMMCGCPVVAAEVGGLRDLVEDDRGARFPVDDAATLANVLTRYLREPERRARHGAAATKWARAFFARDVLYPRYREIYEGRAPSPADPFQADHDSRLRKRADAVAETAVRLLGCPVERVEAPEGSTLSAMRVEAAGRVWMAQPALAGAPDWEVLPGPRRLRPARTAREAWARHDAHRGNPAVAPGLRDPAGGLLLWEWGGPIGLEAGPAAAAGVAAACAAHAPLAAGAPKVSRFVERVRAFRMHPSVRALAAADRAAAALNAPLLGGVERFQPYHPQLELWRLTWSLHARLWVLPAAFRVRVSSVARLLYALAPVALSTPRLCHGDPRPERLCTTTRGPAAWGADETRYAVGPLDSSRYVYGRWLDTPGMGPSAALRLLARMVETRKERHLAACWLFVHVAHGALARATAGQPSALERAGRFFHGLHEAVYHQRFASAAEERPGESETEAHASADPARFPASAV